MKRVSMVGTSGSGKSILGAALARALGAPFVELDAIHHLPDWEPIEKDEFRGQVAELAAGPTWVIDGNYGKVRESCGSEPTRWCGSTTRAHS